MRKKRTIVPYLPLEEAAMHCASLPNRAAFFDFKRGLQRRFGKKETARALNQAKQTLIMVGMEPHA